MSARIINISGADPAIVASLDIQRPADPDLDTLRLEIPQAMREARRWLVWRAEPPEKPEGKARKVPYYASGRKRQGRLDGPEDQAALADFDTAVRVWRAKGFTGLGFALGPDTEGNAWQGIDLDHIDQRPELVALGELLPGYVERSPSGTGLHAIGHGKPFPSLGSNTTGIEAYAKGRYFTVTGEAIRGDIEDISEFVTGTLAPLHSPARQHQERQHQGAAPSVEVERRVVEDLRSALNAIDPGDYHTWIAMGHALASLGTIGRGLWLDWSQGSDKWQPADARRWETFTDPQSDHRAVFAEAQRRGWVNPGSRKAPRSDPPPAPRPDTQGAGTASEPASDDLRDRIKAARVECEKRLAEFNRFNAVVMIEGRACIVYRELNVGTGRYTTRFSTPADISLRFKPSKVPIIKNHDGTEVISRASIFPVWLEWEHRRTFSQMVFKPIPHLVAGDVSLPDADVVNLYQGMAITPKAGDCERIKDHIQNVWCKGEPALYNYVVDWLARMFQRPQERGHTVLLLRSGEGTGKNIIIDVLVEAFGEHAMVAVKPDDLTGRFNDDLATSVLVFANEAVWGGDKSLEGAMKSLITDEELPIERKFIPKFRVKNCCHLIMASNNDWAAPIGLDDRRFVVLDVSEHRKDDFAYFKALRAEIDAGGKEAFIQELLDRDITSFNPRILPASRAFQASKFEAKVRGADTITQWWIDCLYDGEIMATVEREESAGMSVRTVRVRENLAPGWEDRAVNVERDSLYGAYVEWATRLRRRPPRRSCCASHLTTACGARPQTRRRCLPGTRATSRRRWSPQRAWRACRSRIEAGSRPRLRRAAASRRRAAPRTAPRRASPARWPGGRGRG